MAKRKRLTPPNPVFHDNATPALPGPFAARNAPIADVAREAAGSAAFDELAQTLTRAREEGRMVLPLPLDAVQLDHLVRDRLAVDDAEMTALMDSLRARGQQSPIEVADLGDNGPGPRYGLISGWRRCQALRRLHTETNDPKFATVLALLRRPDQASDAYRAMVEENEIRVGLSYFERARIVAKSVEQGVFETQKQALQQLFQSASRPKRSKIGSFLVIVDALDGHLRFPQSIGERAGLALSHALEDDATLAPRLRAVLQSDPAPDATAEQALLSAALSPKAGGKVGGKIGGGTAPNADITAIAALPQPDPHPLPADTIPDAPPQPPAPQPESDLDEFERAPNVRVWPGPDNTTLVLTGPGISPALHRALEHWLAKGDW